WLARNASDRTAAIWLGTSARSGYEIKAATFAGGDSTGTEAIPGSASPVEQVWDGCMNAAVQYWPGHFFAIEAWGDEFVGAWSDAHTGDEEVYVGRRRAPP